MVTRQAGIYATQRYRNGLRRYRRRIRPILASLLAIALVVPIGLAAVRGVDPWSFAGGLVTGGLIAMAIWLRDEPPEFVAKWGRGAEGERRTAKVIRPLLKQGWKVKHDVDLGRGNADHLLLSPGGVGFLLETKALAGRVTVDGGVLTCRFADDPDELRRYQLRPRVTALAYRARDEWSRRTGKPAPELRPVVVIWGAFPARFVRDGQLVYVAGDALVDYLRDSCLHVSGRGTDPHWD